MCDLTQRRLVRGLIQFISQCSRGQEKTAGVTLVGGSSLAGIAVGQQNIIDCLTNLGFLLGMQSTIVIHAMMIVKKAVVIMNTSSNQIMLSTKKETEKRKPEIPIACPSPYYIQTPN